MEKKLEDVSKKVVYTTVGAVVVAAEKAQAVVDELAAKGQEACEKHAVKNEELKRNAKEAFKKAVNVTVVVDDDKAPKPDPEKVMSQIEKLDKEDLAKIKEKLNELEKASAEAAPSEEGK